MAAPCIAIHGGAGTIEKATLTPQLHDMYTHALDQCIEAGYSVLQQGVLQWMQYQPQ